MPPPVIVVEHATGKPSEDCAVASALAGQMANRGEATVSLVRLRGRNAAFSQPGSVEHVLADGGLADNSLLWVERAASSRLRFSEADDLPEAGAEPLVVAFNPALSPRFTAWDLEGRIGAMGRESLWFNVAGDGKGFAVRGAGEGSPGRAIARAERDTYGRWQLSDLGLSASWAQRVGLTAPRVPAAWPSRAARSGLRVAVVGEAAHLRDVFPGVLAALGDAADESETAVEIDIVSPPGLGRADWAPRLALADGLVLPGGSDLGQVAGQIQAASVAIAGGLPTVGLCLGMQSMAVSAARTAAGLPEANLEEVDPDGPCLVFRRLKDERGRSFHRLGAARLRVVPGTRLADCCPGGTLLERLNHRYALAEAFARPLEEAGLRICARSDDGVIADAVEMSGHPFFIGLQSHPELSSRADAPHPMLCGFLRAAARHRRIAARG